MFSFLRSQWCLSFCSWNLVSDRSLSMIFAKMHLPFYLFVTFTSKLVLHQAAQFSFISLERLRTLLRIFMPCQQQATTTGDCLFSNDNHRRKRAEVNRWRAAEMEVSAFCTTMKHLTRWILQEPGSSLKLLKSFLDTFHWQCWKRSVMCCEQNLKAH